MNTITANGKQFTVDKLITLEKFLTQHKLDKRWVVVELNGQPLGRDYFPVTTLKHGDKLEIVTPIAGG